MSNPGRYDRKYRLTDDELADLHTQYCIDPHCEEFLALDELIDARKISREVADLLHEITDPNKRYRVESARADYYNETQALFELLKLRFRKPKG